MRKRPKQDDEDKRKRNGSERGARGASGAAKRGARDGGERAARDGGARGAAKRGARDGGERAARDGSARGTAKRGARDGGERAARDGAKRGTRDGGERAARDGGPKGAVRGARDRGARGTARGARDGGERGAREAGARGTRDGGVRAARTLGDRGPRGATERSARNGRERDTGGRDDRRANGTRGNTVERGARTVERSGRTATRDGRERDARNGSSARGARHGSERAPRANSPGARAADRATRGSSERTARGSSERTARGSSERTARGSSERTARGSSERTARGSSERTARGSSERTARGSSERTERGTRSSARGTRGSARHRDPRSETLEPRPAPPPRRPIAAEDDDPRERRSTTLGRVAKPVARKRPDLSSEPHPGHFLLTTREGSEQDLIDELALLNVVDPPARMLARALVLAPKVPRRDKRPVDLTFARQGFPILQSVHAHDLDTISQRIARSLRGQLERAQQYALHVWVPDSDLGNPLASLAEELESKIAPQLEQSLPDAKRVDDATLRRLGSIPLAQVCLIDPERAVAGVTYSNAALSLARGGRTRVRVTGDFPSRAARKLEEALAWLGVEPSAGDLCVDLGAAPGGWTYVLANRRARVIAVDPAKLRPEILAKKGVVHIRDSAFTFQPSEPVDWLFCDMAWRPLEAAALLAKWGRRRWARMMVANIKLPMTKKADILARVRAILEHEGNWKHVRMKQLYHDRDEITLSAHVG